MTLQELLSKQENKTLEFKVDASSVNGIVKSVVAFANTAGGTIIIGVEDKTKKLIGLKHPLDDEMCIINKISSLVTPLLIPTVDIQTYRKKFFILIHVPYMPGPYYLKKENELIAYIRFGSTNRVADADTVATMKALARNMTFDEIPCVLATSEDIDWQSAKAHFAQTDKGLSKQNAKSLGILTMQTGQERPTNGGILLFGANRTKIFPDVFIRCVRFVGLTREQSSDHTHINEHLPVAIDSVLHFISKNTFVKTKIGAKTRVNLPQYPAIALREAVINSVLHADYAINGSSIIIALFDDRIEITNPGCLPYGLSLEDALAGSSRCRNRVIARTFHALNLIEQWGSGLQKIVQSCIQHSLKSPKFEELGSQFRVTIYASEGKKSVIEQWQEDLLHHLQTVDGVSTNEAARFWKIDIRHARRRLKQLVDDKLITKIGTAKNDPLGKYIAMK